MMRRLASRSIYDLVQEHPSLATEGQRDAVGYLTFRRKEIPVLTAELDEDSFFVAFDEWGSFVEYALGQYAQAHTDVVASIYTFSTGPSPSINPSDGEGHGKVGWHNACFIGVVGQDEKEILDTISCALKNQVGVPRHLVESHLKDPTKLAQISCRNPSDHISFKSNPSWHIEDGHCWAPLGEDVWYTKEEWSQV